jgi:hypothetical protein
MAGRVDDFDEHDQAGVARRCWRFFSAALGVGRDRLGVLTDRPVKVDQDVK